MDLEDVARQSLVAGGHPAWWRNSAFSARSCLSSAIASSADCLVSSATVASDWSRQRRSDSGAIPRSLATCSIAFVSDEYEVLDSVSGLTAFALNSSVYLVPFAMVPSSPIKLGEMRNKNQFISTVGHDPKYRA